MYEFDWTHPTRFSYKDKRTKTQKIKDDFTMIFCINNTKPIKKWCELWLQLIKHILT